MGHRERMARAFRAAHRARPRRRGRGRGPSTLVRGGARPRASSTLAELDRDDREPLGRVGARSRRDRGIGAERDHARLSRLPGAGDRGRACRRDGRCCRSPSHRNRRARSRGLDPSRLVPPGGDRRGSVRPRSSCAHPSDDARSTAARDRTGLRARLPSLPAHLATCRAGSAAGVPTRAPRSHHAARGLRGAGARLGAFASSRARSGLQRVLARRALPHRASRVGAPLASGQRRGEPASRCRLRRDADHARSTRRSPITAPRSARRRRADPVDRSRVRDPRAAPTSRRTFPRGHRARARTLEDRGRARIVGAGRGWPGCGRWLSSAPDSDEARRDGRARRVRTSPASPEAARPRAERGHARGAMVAAV